MQRKKAENLREESPRSSVNEGISTVLYKVSWRWIESGTIAEVFIESNSLAHRLSPWTLGPISFFHTDANPAIQRIRYDVRRSGPRPTRSTPQDVECVFPPINSSDMYHRYFQLERCKCGAF